MVLMKGSLMKVQLIEKRVVFSSLFHSGSFREDEWPEGVNVLLYMASIPTYSQKRATIVYQGRKVTSNGWYANRKPLRFAWNFHEEKLKDHEPTGLVFGHLITNECTLFYLKVTDLPSCVIKKNEKPTILQFSSKIISQLDLLV
jgi:hypothetical protein